jgi:hypothetical protein
MTGGVGRILRGGLTGRFGGREGHAQALASAGQLAYANAGGLFCSRSGQPGGGLRVADGAAREWSTSHDAVNAPCSAGCCRLPLGLFTNQGLTATP